MSFFFFFFGKGGFSRIENLIKMLRSKKRKRQKMIENHSGFKPNLRHKSDVKPDV